MIDEQFKRELQTVLNKNSIDSACNIPDYVLAEYLSRQIAVLAGMMHERDKWFGFEPFGVKSDLLKKERQ